MENEIKIKRKGYMSIAQKQHLIDLLSEDYELRSGKFTAHFTKKVADAKWNGIANKLNAIPGGNKNAQEWKRAWADLKTKTRGKNSSIKKYANKTGGGPSSSTHLNVTDEQILVLINPTTISGHADVTESHVHFSFPNDSNCSTIGNEIAIEGNESTIENVIKNSEIQIEDNEITFDEAIGPIIDDGNFNIISELQNTSSISFGQGKGLGTSNEQDKIQDNVVIEKYPKKTQKRRCKTPAAVRLQKSVTATEQLVEIERQKLVIKQNYYDQKFKLLEQKNQLLLRQVLASEKNASAKEQCKSISNILPAVLINNILHVSYI